MNSNPIKKLTDTTMNLYRKLSIRRLNATSQLHIKSLIQPTTEQGSQIMIYGTNPTPSVILSDSLEQRYHYKI